MVQCESTVYYDPFVTKLRLDLRRERICSASFKNAGELLKEKVTRFEILLKLKDRKIRSLEGEVARLRAEKEELQEKVDTYKGLAFPPKKHREKSKRKLGGQPGHPGTSRTTPQVVTRTVRAWLTVCPDCGSPLARRSHTKQHTVTDIPPLETLHLETVRYEIEEQYCPSCHKHVRALPPGIVPGSRLGVNVLILLLVLRHCLNVSLQKIATLFSLLFHLEISTGALAALLQRLARWFGPQYAHLREAVRAAPWKHADETSWSIAGMGAWVWAFLSNDTALYQIAGSRGKGVAQALLGNQDPSSVTTHDGYAAYDKLPGDHQACWSHLLRLSHDLATRPGASAEVQVLHTTLTDLFDFLTTCLTLPFNQQTRQEDCLRAQGFLAEILAQEPGARDARKVVTYLKNRGTTLLTALLHPEGVLTNNLAERTLRPLVITRHISGGSRSDAGAAALAVNASIIQTIRMRQEPLVSGLAALILTGCRS